MERLTGRNEKGDLLLCGEYVYGNNQDVYNAVELLAAYEDTGLEPEEIRSFLKDFGISVVMSNTKLRNELQKYRDLEEQGRLHIAPVADGRDIFTLFSNPLEDDITEILEATYLHGVTEFEWGEINKDWFLTREEAEKELKEREVNVNE